MKTLRWVAVAGAVVLFVAPVLAQPGADEIGVYFDPAGFVQEFSIPTFVPFSFYVVANPAEDIEAFELSLAVGPDIIVLSATGGPIICIDPGRCGPIDWQVGLGACRPPGVLQLVQVQCLTLVPAFDAPICIVPLAPPNTVPGGVGYQNCAHEPRPFGLAAGWPNLPGCGVLNPTVIATDDTSWGSVKARFDR